MSRTPRQVVARAVPALAVALVATAAWASPAAARPPGLDNACTVLGTVGNDHLYGTHGYDVICGLGGNDTIVGGAGDDVIHGGAGHDTIDGGDGNDTVNGDSGNDRLKGSAGDDKLDGGGGADDFDGGTGTNACVHDKTDTAKPVGCSDVEVPAVDLSSARWIGDTTLSNSLDRTVTLRIRGTDDRSGVVMLYASLRGPDAGVAPLRLSGRRTSGSATAGEWELKGTLPAHSAAGDWRVTELYAQDGVDHYRFYHIGSNGSYTTSDRRLTGRFNLRAVRVSGISDRTPPALDMSSPQWIGDTRFDNSVNRPVRLRGRFTDDLSGVTGLVVNLTNAGSAGPALTLYGGWLISGTATDGVWDLSGTMPAHSAIGDWRVTQVDVKDRVGHVRRYTVLADGTYTIDGGPGGVLRLPALTVLGTSDVSAPAVDPSSLQWVGATTVDNGGNQQVTLRMRIADDRSGVDRLVAYLYPPVNWAPPITVGGTPKLVSGTATDGVWELTTTIRAGTAIGNWRISHIYVTDRVGHVRWYYVGAGGAYTTSDGSPAGAFSLPPVTVVCPPGA